MNPSTSHQFKIYSPETLNRAKTILENLDTSKQWNFDVRPYRRNRSQEQNALYHKWKGIIADELGYGHNELHDVIKEKWVFPILERDDENMKQQLEIVRDFYRKGLREAAERLVKLIKSRVSTTELDTKQFSEMMNNLELFAVENGIPLPQPPEK